MSTMGMFTIIEVIKKNEKRSIYRVKDPHGLSMILKILHNVGYGHSDGVKIRREYQLSSMFDTPTIVKTLEQGVIEGAPYITYEDFGGVSLKIKIANAPLDLGLFFRLALDMVTAISACHSKGLVHRDINPSNFIVSPDLSTIKLADFGISDSLSGFSNSANTGIFLQGTLDYIAPEQTGKLPLNIDYRTDIYCLGATFYEMLTGAVPFDTRECDLTEAIYIHLTNIPQPLIRVNPLAPRALSNLIAKMMAKNPDERYQSVFGVREDLIRLKLMQEREQYTYFEVGLRDASPFFRPCEDLLSRWELFDSMIQSSVVGSIKKSRYQLIKGSARSGKSTLLEAISKRYNQLGHEIIRIYGFFSIANRPYYSLDLAIEAWVDKVCKLLVDDFERVRRTLLRVLGPNIGLLTRTFQSIERIVGEQSIQESNNPQENRTRFNQSVADFFGVIRGEAGHLIILVDDLNHLDEATLKLVQYVLTSHLQFVDFLGSHTTQYENQALLELTESVPFIQFTLESFTLEDVESFLKQSFQWDLGTNQALSEVLFERTHGNPGHLITIVEQGIDDEIIYFDFLTGRWHFNVTRQAQLGVAPSVLEQQFAIFNNFGVVQRERLEVAALMPHFFKVKRLMDLEVCESVEFLEGIAQLCELGFLKTSHRILDVLLLESPDAALSGIDIWFSNDDFKRQLLIDMPKHQEQERHLRLGRTLFNSLQLNGSHLNANQSKANLDEEIRFHFNACNLMDLTEEQRIYVIELNFRAAQMAKSSVAYDVALSEAARSKVAFSALELKNMESLCFEVHLIEAELKYLTRDFAGSERAFEFLTMHSQNQFHKVRINHLKLQLYVNQGETHKVLSLALETLNLLDYPFSEDFSVSYATVQLIKFQWSKHINAPSNILLMKRADDENVKLTLEILNMLMSVSYLLSKILFIRIILAMIELSLKHGMMRLTPFAFATYGILEVSLFRRYNRAFALGKASLEAAKRSGDWEVLAKVNFTVGFFLSHWVCHLRESIDYHLEGKEQSRLSGNMVYFAYNCAALMLAKVALSDNLQDIFDASQLDLMHPDIQTDKDVSNLLVAVREYAAQSLKIERQDVTDELQFERELRTSNMPSILAHYLILKMKLSYLRGEYAKVILISAEVDSLLGELMGLYISVEATYYTALAVLKLRKEVGSYKANAKTYKVNYSKIKAELKRLKKINPINFAHKYEHVVALEYFTSVNSTMAHREFHKAARSAHENGFLLEEGLIFEDLSVYYNWVGQSRLSDVFVKEAYILFRQIGCMIKCDDIKAKHIHIHFNLLEKAMFETQQTRTITTQNQQDHNLQIITKVFSNLTADKLDVELIQIVVKLLLEITGAQKSILMINGENLEVVAYLSHGEYRALDSYESIVVSKRIPSQLIQFSSRSKTPIVLGIAHEDFVFSRDPYIKLHRIKSTLCLPIWLGERQIGMAYLENNLLADAFDKVSHELVQVVIHQFAMAYDHSKLKQHLGNANQQLVRHEENLGELVRERTFELSKTKQEIETLLNEVGEGFLSINSRGQVNPQFSRECLHIFGHDITDEHFHLLLENHVKQLDSNLIKETIEKTFNVTNALQADVYLSLLPQELNINKRVIRLSYKLLDASFLKQITVNLKDITEKIALEREFKQERQQLKMVLNAMRYQNNVRQSIHNFVNFCEGDGVALFKQTEVSERLPLIFRMIHTFKGDFAQWSMHTTTGNIHRLESELSELYGLSLATKSDILEQWLNSLNGNELVAEDLMWIEKYLGNDFMAKEREITIGTADLKHIEARLQANVPKAYHATLHEALQEIAWVPLELVIQQYSQYVQDLAESFGKEIEPIHYVGDAIRLDEEKFSNFLKVLIHFFRNAVQYGIELPKERENLGKPRKGKISVAVKYDEPTLTITIEDDGHGLNLPRIIEKAIDIYPDAAEWELESQMQCIFDFGISSKKESDEVSGRGVGLSAVRHTLEAFSGTVSVASQPSTFTRFTIILQV